MEKLPKLFLSLFIIIVVCSCQSNREKAEQSYNWGVQHYFQGTAGSINGIARAIEIDSTYEQAVYELSVAYLKRGLPHKWQPQYNKAILLDSVNRIPWRGYLYLWFYRDYKKAIADFNASDTLTPNFIDYPQGHSVDYWRGIAYLGLNDYINSVYYWNKHIKKETQETGEEWVEINAFLYRGIAYYEWGDKEKALENFNKVITLFKQSADAKYYKAKILIEKGNNNEANDLINDAIIDFKAEYYNNRPYVETLRQIYLEDLEELLQ